MEQKLSCQNWFLRESVIQGCQMVEFKGQIPKKSYFTNNLHFYFANLATLSTRQLCLLRQKKSEVKSRWKYN
jgi:hypothetical protein